MASQDYNFIFKVLLIGNSSVGKSSLIFRFVDNVYEESFVPTIGVDFKIKSFEVKSKNVKLQIWDTAGQERFKTITAHYYKGAHGILVVYDISDKESFANLNNWLIEIEKNADKNVYKILIGNKNDLEEKRQVTYEQGKEFANMYGMKFFETSAKTSTNVVEAFKLMSEDIIEINGKKSDVIQQRKQQQRIDIKQGASNIGSSSVQKKSCC